MLPLVDSMEVLGEERGFWAELASALMLDCESFSYEIMAVEDPGAESENC